MKFHIKQSVLVDLIQTVSKAVAVRTTKQILTGILLNLSEEQLTATAYDLELGIQDTVYKSEENGLTVEQPGNIVLPARYFSEVIRKLPDQEVLIQVNNNYMTEIRSGQAQFHLHGIDAAEYPKLPVFHESRSIEMPSDLIKEMIRSTAFAASTSEVRPILTGLYFTLNQESLTLTATDGLRLATKTAPVEKTPEQLFSAILPAKSLVELSKLLPDDARPVVMQFTDSHSLFAIDSTLFYTRLIEGSYPDTSRIVPTTHKTEVEIPAELLSGALDRAALIARERENHMVRLEIQGDELTVSSSSPEIGNVSEKAYANGKTGDDLLIAFNAKYVLEALRACSGDISILFNGANQPFIIREKDHEDGLQLISPVLMR